MVSFHIFVFLSGVISFFCIFVLFFYFFHILAWRLFIFLDGVFSSFHVAFFSTFVWRLFVFSSFHVASFRLFAPHLFYACVISSFGMASSFCQAYFPREKTKRSHAKRRKNSVRKDKKTPRKKMP